jgi:hypothetical protein
MTRPWVAERLVRGARDNPALLRDVTDLLFDTGSLHVASIRRAFR